MMVEKVDGFLEEPIAMITSPMGQRLGDRWAEANI